MDSATTSAVLYSETEFTRHTSQAELKPKSASDADSSGSKQVEASLPETLKESKLAYTKKIFNLSLFFIGTMCFKFSYETYSSAIALTVLTRLENKSKLGPTTALGLLTIGFGFAQAVSSTLVDTILQRVRATKILSLALAYFAALVTIMLFLESSTGGNRFVPGHWTPWIIFPIHINAGFCVGVIEVVRKVIPPSILGNNASHQLKRFNSAIHVFYEVAGTVGAFLSTVFIKKLGSVFALCHMPVFFAIGAVVFLIIQPETEDFRPEASFRTLKKLEEQNFLQRTGTDILGTFKSIAYGIRDYFYSLWVGARIIVADRYYIWLIVAFVIPQVLHRVIENILLPSYAKNILKEGSYSGIMLGGSNFGELCGAAILFVLAKKVTSPVWWVRFDALFLNLLWVFPFMPIKLHKGNLIFALCVIPIMMLVSGSWAAGDISLVAYLQATLPDKPPKDSTITPLAAALSFLFSMYVVFVTIIVFITSQVLDKFQKRGKIRIGFMVMCVIFSAISAVIIFISLFIRLKPTEAPKDSEIVIINSTTGDTIVINEGSEKKEDESPQSDEQNVESSSPSTAELAQAENSTMV